MAGSLQDQLLGAGLIQKQKANNIQTAKKKAVKKSRANNTELVDEAAIRAKKAQDESRRKSQSLNKQQKRAAEKKAIQAQIRQIIQLNSIEKTKKEDAENALTYNFTDENIIKSLQVSPQNHDLISRGRLAIAKLTEASTANYHLIPVEAANKINERDSTSLILLNKTAQSDNNDIDDDPYADFQIPDDLMW